MLLAPAGATSIPDVWRFHLLSGPPVIRSITFQAVSRTVQVSPEWHALYTAQLQLVVPRRCSEVPLLSISVTRAPVSMEVKVRISAMLPSENVSGSPQFTWTLKCIEGKHTP